MKKKLLIAKKIKGLLLLGVLMAALPLWGQGGVFPVQVIPQVTPPPPIYLSNYADASTVNSPLRVQLILNDFNIQSRAIRLKAYVQGSGLSFQSTDFITGASPLFLEAGIPLILTNAELAPYFRFENIVGISPNAYANALPEGSYQFCFEVFDSATGNRLSRKSCATTVIFKNEPPFLVSPPNKTNIAETNPQFIIFQWTPRSINVSNVAYELSLVEIWDNQIDPQAAFLSSPPIFQTTTNATTYVFGPSDPQLLLGKNYAWRIQAKAKQGTEEIGLFKNQGYSEIFSFSYATPCHLPQGITHEVKGSTIANIFWEDPDTHIPEYTVRYRKSGGNSAGGSEWFLNKTTANTTSLWGLTAGTTYEYQVNKKCAVTLSDWSTLQQFTTPITDSETSLYQCGITPDFTLTNTEKLQALAKGDTFTAGDFPVKVLEVGVGNGRFSGTGYVTIPYLNSIRVAVQFTNILINTDKQLAQGTVVTYYDANLGNILDIDEAIDTVSTTVEAVGDLTNSIVEALNLDINKDTKQKIDQIVDAMIISMQEESLPVELQNNIETAASEMKEAKERYDSAWQTGDNAAAQTAQNDFNSAQNNLADLQKDIETYKNDVADLIKEALLALFREGRDLEASVYQEYVDAKNERNKEVNEFSDIVLLDYDMIATKTADNVSEYLENLNRVEQKLGTYLFAKILASDEATSAEMNALIKKSKNMGIDFYKEINEKLESNESKSDIIKHLKERLKESFTNLLIQSVN